MWIAGCGAAGGGEGAATNVGGTVNLASLPAAEVWVDGKASGATPMAISLPEGPHEIVLKQNGFLEHRETFDVKSGSVARIDASLDPIDVTDADTVRLVAASFGVTVDPFSAPEIHRGAVSDGGVALFFPRNDIRKEGLTAFRVDVTPAYDGNGWLEFHKGKEVLVRQRFEPDTLVTTTKIPAAVTRAAKVGDTITWGIYYEDGRKAVTTQFEVVSKPAAARKLHEIASDPRMRRQPAILRLQLQAEALQNYRLYSEALMKLLESRATDKNSTMPYTGIVACLRRLDLEDTALFSESAGNIKGGTSSLRGKGEIAALPANHLTANSPRPTAPIASTPRPAGPAPSSGPTPPAPAEVPANQPPATTPPAGTPPATPTGPLASGPLDEAHRLAAEAAAATQQAADTAAAAAAAQGHAADAALAAGQANDAAGDTPSPESVAAATALATANAGAIDAQRTAAVAAARASSATAAANAAALRATPGGSGLPASPTPPAGPAHPSAPALPTSPTHPSVPGVLPVAPNGGLVVPTPANPTDHSGISVATANVLATRFAAQDAAAELATAEADATAHPDDSEKRAAADRARLTADESLVAAADAQAELDRLNRVANPPR